MSEVRLPLQRDAHASPHTITPSTANNLSAGGVEFVPFSIEAGGVWGPAARRFFKECIALANDDRDIDLYHWSSPRFSATWLDTLSVLVARGRARSVSQRLWRLAEAHPRHALC